VKEKEHPGKRWQTAPLQVAPPEVPQFVRHHHLGLARGAVRENDFRHDDRRAEWSGQQRAASVAANQYFRPVADAHPVREPLAAGAQPRVFGWETVSS
jgi:hypothetical protein